MDDARAIVGALKARFPRIVGPRKDDICYATTNRQDAVKRIARRLRAPDRGGLAQQLQLAAPRGSGANGPAAPLPCWCNARLRSIGTHFAGISRLGITAGASAPEVLVEEIIDAFEARFATKVETVITAAEDITFKLPRELRDVPAL